MENSNFVDLLLPKFQNRAEFKIVPSTHCLSLPNARMSGCLQWVRLPLRLNSTPTATPVKASYQLLKNSKETDWPAKSEDMLGSMDSPKESRKSILAIMGRIAYARIAVLKTGGSLFPDL